MPTINVFEGNFLPSVLSGFDATLTGSPVLATAGTVVIEDADDNGVAFTSNLRDFTYGTFNGEPILNGGTINEVAFVVGGTLVAEMDIDLPFSEIQPAFLAELTGSDISAYEDFFLALDWTVNGSDGKEILTPNSKSSDGISLNLTGKDTVFLAGGNDRFASGDGNDVVWGGTGVDKIWGGRGADRLYGEKGRDTLIGQNGNDKMFGGAGNDTMLGGNGNDTMRGGNGADTLDGNAGNDVLTGGNGIDTFIFLGFNYGADTVTDFELGIDLVSGAIRFEGATIEDEIGGALVRASGGSVKFEGLSAEDVQTFLPDAFIIQDLA